MNRITFSARRPHNKRRRPHSRRLELELLENRIVPSSIPLSATSWTPIGPAPIVNDLAVPGNQAGSGRITAVAGDPTNANVLYVAASGGGVWKTTNAGTSWSSLTDNQATLEMGAIAIAPSNPNVIYAGTGDSTHDFTSFYGRGLLKSTDGGATWTLLTGNAGVNEFDRRAISKIVVDPTNSNVVYVALDKGENGLIGSFGIYKSTDGGTTWTNTTTSITTDSLAFFTDLVLDPSNPQTLYAAVGRPAGNAANGVYRSTDGGNSWSVAGNFPIGAGDGLIKIAIAPSSPQELFAAISIPTAGGTDVGLLELLKSTDGGMTWNVLPKTPNYMGTQGYFNSTLAVDPNNSNVVYAAGQDGKNSVIESTDGGNTWNDISMGADGNGPHADHHGIGFDASGRLLDGNDGGIWRLDNADPKNSQWTDLNANLNTITFYGVALNPANPNIGYGGSQDNGTEEFTGSLGWTELSDSDGGFVWVDPSNPNTVYHESQYPAGNIFLQRSDDGGTKWKNIVNGINLNLQVNVQANFMPPFVLDASNPSRLVLGTNVVYETTDQGAHWNPLSSPGVNGWTSSQPITALGLANGDANTMYATTNDLHIFVTTNHGASWQQRDIPGIPQNVFPAVPSPLASITVDPTNEAIAYVAVDEFTSGSGGHVYRTTDYGQDWTDISAGLPSVPTSAIVLDPRTSIVYVGNDLGVYASNNGGASWTRFETGLPNVRVGNFAGSEGLALSPALNILAAGTFGRGMWEIATAHFGVTASRSTVSAGKAISVTVTALDPFGATITGYTGTVHFTSSDGSAVLPADYTFTTSDKGVHTFTGVVLNTPGSQTITATDTLNGAVNGSATVQVAGNTAGQTTVAAVSTSATAGAMFRDDIGSQDAFFGLANAVTPGLAGGRAVFALPAPPVESSWITAPLSQLAAVTDQSGGLAVRSPIEQATLAGGTNAGDLVATDDGNADQFVLVRFVD